MNLYFQESAVDFQEIEEALLIVKQRKEKESQELDFLHKVDDERHKGLFGKKNQRNFGLVHNPPPSSKCCVVACCSRQDSTDTWTQGRARGHNQRAGENKKHADSSAQNKQRISDGGQN